MAPDAAAAVDAVYRSDWGRIVATLIRLVGDFEIAEDSAQEAFTAAVEQWRTTGVPEFPRAWIIQTARHKAIDRIRRQARFADKLDTYAAESPQMEVKVNLAAAQRYGVDLITRVVDYGGLFWDDVRPGHAFAQHDHRAFRPPPDR